MWVKLAILVAVVITGLAQEPNGAVGGTVI